VSVGNLLDALLSVASSILLALVASWFAGINLLRFLSEMREPQRHKKKRIKTIRKKRIRTILRGVWAVLLLTVPLALGYLGKGWPVLQVMLVAAAGGLAFSTLIVPAIGRSLHQNPEVARILAGGVALLIGLIPFARALRGQRSGSLLESGLLAILAVLNIGLGVWKLWHD